MFTPEGCSGSHWKDLIFWEAHGARLIPFLVQFPEHEVSVGEPKQGHDIIFSMKTMRMWPPALWEVQVCDTDTSLWKNRSLRQILWHIVAFSAQEPGVAKKNEDVSLGILTQVSVWSLIS